MKYGGLLILIILVLVGCSTSENIAPAVISKTELVHPTSVQSSTVVSQFDEILDSKGVWMRLIPAGKFTMGRNVGFDERPAHSVYLDAYYIDKYEVANVFYKACVDQGVCKPPKKISSATHTDYYTNLDFNIYPVVYVDFNMAKTYCEWRGAKLPSEAQWEKAARGTDQRTYPWGEGIDESLANYNSIAGDTNSVLSYAKGVSPYGIYNMSGNVSEWIADWYVEDYFQHSPSSNPQGPESSNYRVLRGGSWSGLDGFVSTTYRTKVYPESAYYDIGFRCVSTFAP